MNRPAAIVEQQGRDADISLGWGYVEVEIHTLKVDGLTRAAAELAARFDAMNSEFSASLPPGATLRLPSGQAQGSAASMVAGLHSSAQ